MLSAKPLEAGRKWSRLLLLVFYLDNSYTMKIDSVCFSETSVCLRTTRRYIPEDGNVYIHRRGNLRSKI
jgi:hypothetical protein